MHHQTTLIVGLAKRKIHRRYKEYKGTFVSTNEDKLGMLDFIEENDGLVEI
jgi:hypothetical protein